MRRHPFRFCVLMLALVPAFSLTAFAQTTSPMHPLAAHTRAVNGSDFDAARAYNQVKKLCDLGPHPAGSEAIKRAQDYLEKELKSYGLTVTEDDFVGKTPKGAIPMLL